MRIELVFGGEAQPGEAALVEGDGPAPAGTTVERFRRPASPLHGIGCLCCAPRGPAAVALGRLFLARARGEAPWFSRVRVIADDQGIAAVRAALTADAITMARFVETSDPA